MSRHGEEAHGRPSCRREVCPTEERVSEAAGVNSAAGSFGVSFGLAFAGAILLATLSFSFTNLAQASTVLPAAEKQQVA